MNYQIYCALTPKILPRNRGGFLRVLFLILKYVSRLAVQRFADGLQRGETDGFCLTRLQDGEVGLSDANLLGQLLRRHLALGHHHVYIYDYTHSRSILGLWSDGQVLFFLQLQTDGKHFCYDEAEHAKDAVT